MTPFVTAAGRAYQARHLTTAIVACALAAAVSAQQQAPDRSKPPAIGPAPALHLPAVEKRILSNGLHVWIMGVHKHAFASGRAWLHCVPAC